jgi:predicted permease
MFHSVLRDIRYGVRQLLRSPGFTTVAVLSLALGICGNAMIFSLVNAYMFKPLSGVKDPSRLVWVYSSDRENGSTYGSSSFPDFQDYHDQSNVFDGLAAFDGTELSMNAGGEAEVVRAAFVTGDFFNVLGVEPTSGRAFLPEENKTPGTHPVVMLSYGFWQRRFGADAGLINKTLNVNGIEFTVVGVSPKGFTGAEGSAMPDIWVPMMMHNRLRPPVGKELDRLTDRHARWLSIVGRLKPGVGIDQAQAALSIIAVRLAQTYSDTNENFGVTLAQLSGKLDPRDREELLPVAGLLTGVVGFVLLIACANVGNLLLMRASKRHKEIAIRLALGASRADLVRQLLTETLLLFLLAGLAGMFVADRVVKVVAALMPADKPLSTEIGLDLRVFGFALLLSLVTGIIFGLTPALRASNPNLIPALKDDMGSQQSGYSRSRLRSLFVVAQVTLSVALLIGAGLFIRSLRNTRSIDPGFKVENALLVPVDLKFQRYTEPVGLDFQRRLLENVRALPGVTGASYVRDVPLGSSSGFMVVTTESVNGQEGFKRSVGANVAGAGYFQTLGIPLARGRDFGEQDRQGAPPVAIVNQTFVDRTWPGEDPVGKRISINSDTGPFAEIIGVAKDSKYRSLEENPTSLVYLPLQQQDYQSRLTLVVRTSGDPEPILPTVRNQVRSLDNNLPLAGMTTLSQHVNLSLLPSRVGAWFLGIFGLLALILAVIGLYGVVAYSVGNRTREIGIRMALGAERTHVLKMVLREGMVLAGSGVALGVIMAFIMTRLLQGFIYGISATDPLTFAGVALVMILVAVAACYLPASKATTIDPNIALRYE